MSTPADDGFRAARADNRLARNDNPQRCYHCALTQPLSECGPAEVTARWVDQDGVASQHTVDICRECLRAGAPGGPGYILEAMDLGSRVSRHRVTARRNDSATHIRLRLWINGAHAGAVTVRAGEREIVDRIVDALGLEVGHGDD